MKRILVYLYAYKPFANANTNVMQPFIERLKQSYKVDILTARYDINAPKEECVDGITVYRYNRPGCIERILVAAQEADIRRKRALWEFIALVLLHIIGKSLNLFERTDEFKTLKALVSSNNYDMILATCEAYRSLKNVLRLRKKCESFPKWVSYFMDPHSYYIGNGDKFASLIDEEKEIYRCSDLILTTAEIFRENQTNAFREFLYKTQPIPFGNLHVNDLPQEHRPDDKIRCVFAGSLVDLSVRNPEYFYKLIAELDERFHFIFVCKSMDPQNRRMFDQYFGGRPNVELKINLSLNASLACIAGADILINFGNKAANQTPSKIFDYISTGLPIVNVFSITQDTAKHYLSDYDHKLNIYEDDTCLGKSRDEFAKFCFDNKHRRVSPQRLRAAYGCYTAEAASEEFIRKIDFLLDEKPGAAPQK